jgi:dTDP-4-dehydrorhamnose reductase
MSNSSDPQRLLVLGVTGMLGSAMFRVLSKHHDVWGACRSGHLVGLLPEHLQNKVVTGVDVENPDSLVHVLGRVRPSVIVNCVGVVKQLRAADDPLIALPLNSLLPHRLAQLAALSGARLVHISTDCVFSGRTGSYTESDVPDATDLYGQSKRWGEVDYENAVTLRTSIIGHELQGARSLLCWFLDQKDSAKGFTRAVFSGLPTDELSRIIRDFVIPHPAMRGVYHVAAERIDKYTLLAKIARAYGKNILLIPDDGLVIDRSLSARRFEQATGYKAPPWDDLIQTMHDFNKDAIHVR